MKYNYGRKIKEYRWYSGERQAVSMKREIGIGIQSFEKVMENHCFYVDKTAFIKDWWESKDDVTLITRPRRFGKTLNMSMVETFFSIQYAGRNDLFEGLNIWNDEEYRKLQGTYPVINISFSGVKGFDFEDTKRQMAAILRDECRKYDFLLHSERLSEVDRNFYRYSLCELKDDNLRECIKQLCGLLEKHYAKKVIVILDEYDTPMQEAYVSGFWNEIVKLMGSMLNYTFKSNTSLEKGLLTGITRVSKESIFSDLNNLNVATITSNEYVTSFGFTEKEVFDSLDEYGLGDQKEEVKRWYDGFTFGEQKEIYNPWSIINFLKTGEFSPYWVNTSSNALVSELIRNSGRKIKQSFEALLNNGSIICSIDEQIVYNRLDRSENAIWSLLLAAGYLKVEKKWKDDMGNPIYKLSATNHEVRMMFVGMVKEWFEQSESCYEGFLAALLRHDVEEMNEYMNRITMNTFSYFDTGKGDLTDKTESFYHGFVLGLMVELSGRYTIISNRESGFGRYDVMLEPKDALKDAIIIEFKVHDSRREASLKETVSRALQQIEDKKYKADLISRGFNEDQIKCYGFAFKGKEVLINTV